MPLTGSRIKRLLGMAAVVLSIALIISFILSEAWFGVMLALFIGVVGLQIVMAPDKMLRSGEGEEEEDFDERFRRSIADAKAKADEPPSGS